MTQCFIVPLNITNYIYFQHYFYNQENLTECTKEFKSKIVPTFIMNFSAHSQPTGVVHYSLGSSCRQDSKDYEINLRGVLGAE